jgi:SecD/SecF fusion protein
MEHKFTFRFTLIGAVLLLGILGIFDPSKLLNMHIPWSQKLNLKPGIDISGGTSLIYQITPPPGGATEDLSQRVAESLKKRVDPDGVRNLVWRPLGPTRLEIQMPWTAGSEKAGEARHAFSKAMADLEATNIRVAEVKAVMRIPDATQRQRELDRLAMGSATRKALFGQLAEAMKHLDEVQKTGDAVAKVEAKDALTKVEDQISATNLPASRVQSELDLFQSAVEKAQKMGNTAMIAQRTADRDAKFEAMKKDALDFPLRLKAIDEVVARYDAYAKTRGSVGDAEDLKRLLRGSGVLEFHIAVSDPQVIKSMEERLRTDGPTPRPGDTARWYEVDQPDEMRGHHLAQYGDKSWLLVSTTPDESMVHKQGTKPWGLQRAYKDYDGRTNEAVVGFEFDAQGSVLFGDLSGANIGKSLAIVLDDKVISAPVLRSRIEGRGQISGNYSDAELNYLIRTLNAGSLPAKLDEEPISERTIGPSLGADNLRAGFKSALLSVVAVAVFMIGYYHYAGLIATIAVVMNLIVNIGVLAMFNATFTLPGIAALALTVGMAVDANVLIFERLREEQHRGLSLRMALRNAYDRAFSAIFDSNITTIATSMILYWFGSEEIRGFGLTLTIGVAISMFTALFVTRAIFDYGIEHMGLKHLGSFPLSFPKWDQFMKPNIDWMGKAWMFYAFSTVVMVTGLVAYFSKGRQMYDIEFVSGTSVQVALKHPMGIEDVRKRLQQPEVAKPLDAAQVVSVGNTGADYEIVTPNEDAKAVRGAVMTALRDDLKIELPSTFTLAGQPYEQAVDKAVMPIGNDPITVDAYTAPATVLGRGGVAIVLKNLDPALTPKQIYDRIERLRSEPGSNLPFREMKVDSPGGPDKPTNLAVVTITDPVIDYEKDAQTWQEQLARPMWKLVSDAIGRQADMGRITSFNASVAADTKLDAIIAVALSVIAIALYVWVRFGNLKYGTATVVSLLHDVIITIGLIGLSQYVGEWAIGRALLIEPMRMNLTMIAAVLTVMGYSVNDTIIVFDRIREYRGKYGYLSREVINDAVNHTLSRTLLTSFTTLATIFVMYVLGGPGIHGFTFAMLFGILFGTYSSVAIASPILLLGGKDLLKPVAAKAKKPAAGQLKARQLPA